MIKSMAYYLYFLAISLGWNLLRCDATVTVSLISSANGVDTLECRSDGVVSCRINPYAGLINWAIDGTPYVTCSPLCIENPSITRTYSPTYDDANGVFNLTVDNANYNDTSTTFKCDDGSSLDDITMKVVPAYSENETNINDTDGGKQVEFKTTCVQPGVEFDWFTVTTNNSDRKPYYKGQKIKNTETTACSLDSACGGVGTFKVTSTVTIPTVSDGEERYLEIVVKYKNPDEERTFRFDEIFHFEDKSTDNDSGLPTVAYVGIACGCLVAVILCLFAVSRAKRKKKKEINTTVNETKRLCDSCNQPETESQSKNECIYCTYFLCNNCIQNHVEEHIARRTRLLSSKGHSDIVSKASNENKTTGNKPNWSCDSCNQPQIESQSENECIYCKDILCKKCTQKHVEEHIAIVTKHMLKQSFKGVNCFVSQASNGINLNCSHNEKNIESYCLWCKQYLCKWCIINHAEHRILRHFQQGAGKARCQILCKFCQNMSIRSDAMYYSKDVKGFVCEDCKTKRGLKDIVAIHDLYSIWQCKRCIDNNGHTPAECTIDDEKMCAVCFKKSQSLRRSIETRESEQIMLCAVQSVARERESTTRQQIEVNEAHSDVLCYVCNEYLCNMCFIQHLDFKHF